MVGFEKALGAVKVIKDQIQYRSQSLLNLARGYFRSTTGTLCQKGLKDFDTFLFWLKSVEWTIPPEEAASLL